MNGRFFSGARGTGAVVVLAASVALIAGGCAQHKGSKAARTAEDKPVVAASPADGRMIEVPPTTPPPPPPASSPAAHAAGGPVEFELPDQAAYEQALWPAHNDQALSATNYQGKASPVGFGKEEYITPARDRKGRVVVVDFWATWCRPCRQAMPGLEKLQTDYPDDLVIIGISDEPEAKVRGFTEAYPHEYAQAVDTSRTMQSAFGVRGIPHAVVFSTDGVVRWQGNPGNIRELRQVVDTLVKNDPGVTARREAETKAAGK